MKPLILISTVFLFSCQNTSNILPEADFDFVEEYHCYPYDVKVYAVDNVKIDSQFYSYPLKQYFRSNDKYDVSTWESYADFDTSVSYGMDSTLKHCDDGHSLFDQIMNNADVYYAGCFELSQGRNGVKKRSYEKILFLDLTHKKVYIMKYFHAYTY